MTDSTSQSTENTGKFQKGRSGNPAGRPRARHKPKRITDHLSKADFNAIVAKLVEQAAEGNTQAAAILMARAWPAPKPAGRMLSGFQLPVLCTAEDVAAALAVVIACISNSLLTLEEANNLSALIERQGAALAASDHEKRLLALEATAPKQIGRM
jgi:Family of unknown function (DUF5681)